MTSAVRTSADYSATALAAAAGADPWALHGQLASGDPDAIVAAGDGFRRTGELAAEAGDHARHADLLTAGAYLNDGRPVFDAAANTARSRSLLGDGGEKLEAAARAFFDVAAALAESTRRSAARVAALEADISHIIALRNAFFASNAAALTPPAAAAAEQRHHGMAVDATRSAAGRVRVEVDDYEAVLANRTGRLQALGYLAQSGQPSDQSPADPDVEEPAAPQGPLDKALGFADEVIADEVEGVGSLAILRDAADDAVAGAITDGLSWAGEALGGPVGAALSGTADALARFDEAGDEAVGAVGEAVGDGIGGATGDAIADAAREIAGDGPTPPPAALTPQQRADLDHRLTELERQHPAEFDGLQRDPDQGGNIRPKTQDEARVGLDLREQGRLPADLQRPPEPRRGDYYSPSTGRYYDLKGIHSDWPPLSDQRDRSVPFRDAYDPSNNAKILDNIEEQFTFNRTVILDVRNADQAAISDLERIVNERGWQGDVIWYP